MTVLFDGRASEIGAGPWVDYLLGPWTETSWRIPDNNYAAGAGRGERRCTLVQDPLGIKGQVVRSELFSTDGAAITVLADSRRSELAQIGVLQVVGSTYMVKLSTLIQSPWVEDDGSCPTTIFQIHDTADGGDPSRGPPLEMAVEGDRLVLTSRSSITGGTDASGQVLRELYHWPLADILDEWQDWVLQITWQHTSGGAIKLWRNRRVEFQESTGKNCYNDAAGNFTAHGVYCPVGWPAAGVSSRIAYTTGMVIGDAAETFLSFTGAAELERVMPVRMAAA